MVHFLKKGIDRKRFLRYNNYKINGGVYMANKPKGAKNDTIKFEKLVAEGKATRFKFNDSDTAFGYIVKEEDVTKEDGTIMRGCASLIGAWIKTPATDAPKKITSTSTLGGKLNNGFTYKGEAYVGDVCADFKNKVDMIVKVQKEKEEQQKRAAAELPPREERAQLVLKTIYELESIAPEKRTKADQEKLEKFRSDLEQLNEGLKTEGKEPVEYTPVEKKEENMTEENNEGNQDLKTVDETPTEENEGKTVSADDLLTKFIDDNVEKVGKTTPEAPVEEKPAEEEKREETENHEAEEARDEIQGLLQQLRDKVKYYEEKQSDLEDYKLYTGDDVSSDDIQKTEKERNKTGEEISGLEEKVKAYGYAVDGNYFEGITSFEKKTERSSLLNTLITQLQGELDNATETNAPDFAIKKARQEGVIEFLKKYKDEVDALPFKEPVNASNPTPAPAPAPKSAPETPEAPVEGGYGTPESEKKDDEATAGDENPAVPVSEKTYDEMKGEAYTLLEKFKSDDVDKYYELNRELSVPDVSEERKREIEEEISKLPEKLNIEGVEISRGFFIDIQTEADQTEALSSLDDGIRLLETRIADLEEGSEERANCEGCIAYLKDYKKKVSELTFEPTPAPAPKDEDNTDEHENEEDLEDDADEGEEDLEDDADTDEGEAEEEEEEKLEDVFGKKVTILNNNRDKKRNGCLMLGPCPDPDGKISLYHIPEGVDISPDEAKDAAKIIAKGGRVVRGQIVPHVYTKKGVTVYKTGLYDEKASAKGKLKFVVDSTTTAQTAFNEVLKAYDRHSGKSDGSTKLAGVVTHSGMTKGKKIGLGLATGAVAIALATTGIVGLVDKDKNNDAAREAVREGVVSTFESEDSNLFAPDGNGGLLTAQSALSKKSTQSSISRGTGFFYSIRNAEIEGFATGLAQVAVEELVAKKVPLFEKDGKTVDYVYTVRANQDVKNEDAALSYFMKDIGLSEPQAQFALEIYKNTFEIEALAAKAKQNVIDAGIREEEDKAAQKDAAIKAETAGTIADKLGGLMDKSDVTLAKVDVEKGEAYGYSTKTTADNQTYVSNAYKIEFKGQNKDAETNDIVKAIKAGNVTSYTAIGDVFARYDSYLAKILPYIEKDFERSSTEKVGDFDIFVEDGSCIKNNGTVQPVVLYYGWSAEADDELVVTSEKECEKVKDTTKTSTADAYTMALGSISYTVGASYMPGGVSLAGTGNTVGDNGRER